MKNIFNSVKVFKPGSNLFDLSHDHKLSCNMGYLNPVLCLECVPGDKINVSQEALIRLAPMTSPVMHRMNVMFDTFYVPSRLLWPNFENYITNTKVGGSLPAFPTIDYHAGNYTPLMDMMGLPDHAKAAPGVRVTAMQFAAYQKIYNEYYRDQNLSVKVKDTLEDGDNTADIEELTDLRKRAWEHDYFTASLPFAQKGDAVEIPVTGMVTLDPSIIGSGRDQPYVNRQTGLAPTAGNPTLGPRSVFPGLEMDDSANQGVLLDPNATMEVETADTNINDLRRAYALQRFLEKLARGGSRLIEVIRTVFGVNSSDKRLQRPEYITGTKSPIVISEVLNTTGTDDAPQGDMAGHGVATPSGRNGHYFCEEHGYLITIMSVIPRTAYQQGIEKQFLKFNDPFEFFWPDFANIGEQEVTKQEVYVDSAIPEQVWGYVPRYSEYKYCNGRTSGEFKTTLNNWTMTRIFSAEPSLNQEFIECNPTHRIFAVTDVDQDKLWCHVYNKVHMRRLMPKYGTPTF